MTREERAKRSHAQSPDYVFRSLLAGGIAGCIAKTTVAPLDRVKILFQASNPEFQKYSGTWTGVFKAARDIKRDYGVVGLFQGHTATLLRIFPYAAIKFMAYDQAHKSLMPTTESETNVRRFIAGSASGMVSVLFTYPLELLRVRLAFETKSDRTGGRPTLSSTFRTIYNEGTSFMLTNGHRASLSPSSSITPPPTNARLFESFPILKFYRGFTVTLLGMIPYAGTSFLIYGHLRSLVATPHRLDNSSEPSPKPRGKVTHDLFAGAVAGAVAQTVSYPFEVVRRRMQVGGLMRPGAWQGFGETVRAVWKRSGWRGFFVGLSIGYLKIIPMTAVSFASWEYCKHLLGV
ncbi:mitochondrial carrier domain-containing protein [Cantharellus anzutake]|uniref:mitochondrial carrier domain-containing protein n=1 Tax=Cantharellus anzutake TaxID=1750568 RepID=UPI0019049E32|nr:mitochondrial carrier domain-containing protein [Cantharellus anzutake]KAF8340320.1 mitochondrial carrier domain-containing protein [Cantharellus anzutake]